MKRTLFLLALLASPASGSWWSYHTLIPWLPVCPAQIEIEGSGGVCFFDDDEEPYSSDRPQRGRLVRGRDSFGMVEGGGRMIRVPWLGFPWIELGGLPWQRQDAEQDRIITEHGITIGIISTAMPLSLAIGEWEAAGKRWRETGGLPPDLAAFLCGWFAFDLYDDRPPDPDRMRDSWRAGWFEAEAMAAIEAGSPSL